MIATRLRGVADDPHDLVLGPGSRRVREVGQRREELLQPGLGLPRALAELLDLRGDLLQALELRRYVLLLALARRDLLGCGLLLGAQRLRQLRRLTPGSVELDDAVDALGHIGAAPRQRRANRLGIAADQPQVKHGAAASRRLPRVRSAQRPPPDSSGEDSSPPGNVSPLPPLPVPPAGTYGLTLLPAYSARNSAIWRFCSPVAMFSGMIAPEKPPFSIA